MLFQHRQSWNSPRAGKHHRPSYFVAVAAQTSNDVWKPKHDPITCKFQCTVDPMNVAQTWINYRLNLDGPTQRDVRGWNQDFKWAFPCAPPNVPDSYQKPCCYKKQQRQAKGQKRFDKSLVCAIRSTCLFVFQWKFCKRTFLTTRSWTFLHVRLLFPQKDDHQYKAVNPDEYRLTIILLPL